MYDGNPVHIHTGRYPRGIDVSNFVPEERFSGGGVQIWWPFVSYLYFFSRLSVDTDSNKAKRRKNLKHKYA